MWAMKSRNDNGLCEAGKRSSRPDVQSLMKLQGLNVSFSLMGLMDKSKVQGVLLGLCFKVWEHGVDLLIGRYGFPRLYLS